MQRLDGWMAWGKRNLPQPSPAHVVPWHDSRQRPSIPSNTRPWFSRSFGVGTNKAFSLYVLRVHAQRETFLLVGLIFSHRKYMRMNCSRGGSFSFVDKCLGLVLTGRSLLIYCPQTHYFSHLCKRAYKINSPQPGVSILLILLPGGFHPSCRFQAWLF